MFAVQTIHTTWTKNSRGGDLAVLRNRVPTRAPLRLSANPSGIVWHSLSFGEQNKFNSAIADKLNKPNKDNQFGCNNIFVQLNDTSATLTYRYRDGAPARQFYDTAGTPVVPEHSIVVQPNQWATVEYNGRSTYWDCGTWYYEHVVVNLAVGDRIESNVFTAGSPIEHYKQIASLW